MRRLLVVAWFMVLTGCATQQPLMWDRPDVPMAQRGDLCMRDSNYCQVVANGMTPDQPLPSPPPPSNNYMNSFMYGYSAGSVMGAPARSRSIFINCMQSKGWVRMKEGDSNFPDPVSSDEQDWRKQQREFFALEENKIFLEDDRLYQKLNAAVIEISNSQKKDSMNGTQILWQARSKVVEGGKE